MSKNAAPHSGAVSWVRGLVERINEPMTRLKSYKNLLDGEEG